MKIVRWYGVFVCAASAVLGGVLLFAHQSLVPDHVLKVTFLNIGQGDAIYALLPNGESILIDGGPDTSVIRDLGRVMPWWQHRIDYVVITHPDRDHFAGLLSVVDKYEIGTVFYNGDMSGDSYFQRLLASVKDHGIPLKIIKQGQELDWPEGVRLRFLWPGPGYRAEGRNETSIVTELSWGNIEFLMMADVAQPEELEIIHDYPGLSAEVLKVGHHGSKYSSGELFLAAIHPQYCVISAGRDNRYGHPHPRVLDALAAVSCKILKTYDEGAITLVTDGQRLWQTISQGL